MVAELEVRAYGRFGLESGRTSLRIAPGGKIEGSIDLLLPGLNDDRGWLWIDSNVSELSGVMTFQSLQLGGIASLPLIDNTSRGLAFASLENNDARQSGLVLTAPGTEEATAKLVITAADLTTHTVEIQLGSRGKWVGMLADLYEGQPPEQASVQVYSSHPLTGFALTFQDNVQQIFAVPARQIENAEVAAWRTKVAERFAQNQIRTGVAAGYQIGGLTPVIAAAGYADIEQQIPAHEQMISEIGSISKSFTAAILLLLQEDGLVDLDAPVSTYVQNVPRGDSITTRMLLNHTTGLANYTEFPEIEQAVLAYLQGGEAWTIQQILDLAYTKDFHFEPGTSWRYSNTGYLLAGQIAETVSGQPLVELYRTRIFEPLGMEDSYLADYETTPERAVPYLHDDGEYHDVSGMGLFWAGAAGGIISTNYDMMKWATGLFEGQLLQPQSLEQMLTPAPQSSELPYGLGIVIAEINGQPIYTHNGGTFGGSSSLVYFPNQRLTFSILVNCDEMDPGFSYLLQDLVRDLGLIAKKGPQETPFKFHKRLAAGHLTKPFAR